MIAAGPPGEPLAALAALASAALWALGCVLFERVLVREGGRLTAAAANLFKNVLALVVLAGVWVVLGGRTPPAAALPALLLSGLLGFAVGDTLYFAAIGRAGSHAVAMVGNLAPPFAALLSFLFQGVRLSPGTLGCMGIVLGGIALVLSDSARQSGAGASATGRARAIGWTLGVLACLAQAVAIVVANEGFAGVQVVPGTVVRIVGGVAGAVVIATVADLARGRGEARALLGPLRSPRLGVSLLVPTLAASVFCLPLYGLAVRDARPGVAAVLLATTPLFTLPLSRLLGVRYGGRTLLGTLLGFGGVAALILEASGPG